MALSLGVKLGSVIWIDNSPLKVTEVHSNLEVVVEFEGKQFTITDLEKTSLTKDLCVQVGVSGSHGRVSPRLLLDAPRHIRIERDEIREKDSRYV